MIPADKIMELRKKNGWFQEEFAEKLNVSRQAVSKWEDAQSTPDLGRILQMAELFGVTTDSLLRDEIGADIPAQTAVELPMRRVSMEEANEYLSSQFEAGRRIAGGAFVHPFARVLSGACGLQPPGGGKPPFPREWLRHRADGAAFACGAVCVHRAARRKMEISGKRSV